MKPMGSLKSHCRRPKAALTVAALASVFLISGCDPETDTPTSPMKRSAIAAATAANTALDFPSNGSMWADVRIRWTGAALQPMYPATYIWRYNPRQQQGYYSGWYYGPANGFDASKYYTAAPYPDGSNKSSSTAHHWALRSSGNDFIDDASGANTQVAHGTWKIQALRVSSSSAGKLHEYFWDLPDTTKVIRRTFPTSYGAKPSNPSLSIGDAPGNLRSERTAGLVRGLQTYSAKIGGNDLVAEVNSPMASAAGSAAIWYLNLNPTPSDISDKSGKGHNPAWVSSTKAALWTDGGTPPPSAPTVSLSANPTSVASGNGSTLTWSSTNATSCNASGAWSGSKAISGSQSTGNLSSSQTYTLTCTGEGGSANQSATVTVTAAPPPVPTVSLSANPTTIASGAGSTLTWSSTNATSCNATGAWSGSKAISGSQSTGNLTSSQTYTLTCTGAGGSANQSATVTVTAAPPPVPTVSLTANPTSISSGGSSTLTWSSTNATSCNASGAWSGSQAISGTQSTGNLSSSQTYTLTCTGAGGSANQSATVTVTAAPPPAPTVSLTANPTSINSGSGSTLTWSSTNATSCNATGAWSGSKAISGTQSTGNLSSSQTYTLTCTGAGGSANQSATVTVSDPPPGGGQTGLDFPSNGQTSADIRFRFTGGNLQPMYPATYIWRVKLRQHSGYYTTFFWGPDGEFTGNGYYGAHPYPDGEPKDASRAHKWEVSASGHDYVEDANGHSTQLGYDTWRTQAMRVWDNGTNKVHEFFWDLPDTTKVIRVLLDGSYGPNGNPAALTFGDAPWNIRSERLSGILRGIQTYTSKLGTGEINSEANAPMSTPAGSANVWYVNVNPTPSDISDKSGKGHHPSWVTSNKATLWTGP